MTVSFTIPGEPKGKGRPRFARAGSHVRTYTPAETVSYENLVKISYLQDHQGVKLTGALGARIVGVFPIPQSASKKRQALMRSGEIHYTKKIDCDNLAKTVLDALNGIAYDDDKQICRLTVDKVYGDAPRVEVTVEEISAE